MVCPECGNDKTYVVGTVTDIVVERYRHCKACGHTFVTQEKLKPVKDVAYYIALQDALVKAKKVKK